MADWKTQQAPSGVASDVLGPAQTPPAPGPQQSGSDLTNTGLNKTASYTDAGTGGYTNAAPQLSSAEEAQLRDAMRVLPADKFALYQDYEIFSKNQAAKLDALLNSSDPRIRAAAATAVANQPVDPANYKGSAYAAAELQRAQERSARVRDQIAKGEIDTTGVKSNPSISDVTYAKAMAGRTEFDPTNNPALRAQADMAGRFASGQAGNELGGAAAFQAAQDVANTGRDARQLSMDAARQQFGQASQSGQDLGMVRDAAAGRGPSAASILGQKMIDDSSRAMSAQAASARGGNLASANRAAILGGSQQMLQGSQQIAAQRAAEQATAQSLLTQGNAALGQQYSAASGAAGAVRAGDVGQAQGAAQALNSTYGVNSANAQAGLQSTGNVTQQYAGALTDRLNAENSDRDWLQRQYGIQAGNAVNYSGQAIQSQLGNRQLDQAATGQILGLVGAAAGAAGSLGAGAIAK